MSRTHYAPALAAVYLDRETIQYLSTNLHSDLWKIFIQKIRDLFQNIPIHILVSKEMKPEVTSLLADYSNITLHDSLETEEDFLKTIAPILPSSQFNDPDWDEVCLLYFKGISPLADVSLMTKSWERHKRFFSQYSYSENLPEGIIPYILTREFLATLPDRLPTDVHAFFLKNINHYDVDIFYVPPDLRQYRFDFRLNGVRNADLVKKLLNINLQMTYEEILPAVQKNPPMFRLAPTYIEWEIYKGCELECIFCPRQLIDKSDEPIVLSYEKFRKVLENLNSEIKTPYTVCLGGNGEPLLHPQISKIIHDLLDSPHLKELIIETALYQNVNELLTCIENLQAPLKNKLTIIVNLSTLNSSTYTKLYGKNILNQVLQEIDRLKPLLPPSSLYVQMIKMLDVGEEVESFFTYFEKKDINVILQKYNRFAGKLPERRVSDLTPIHRDFCWHLNRDLVIDVSANVSICKQNQTEILGNLLSDAYASIWEKGHEYFSASLLGEHGKIPAPCLNCDEWYTFNA